MAQEAYMIFKTKPFDGFKLGSQFSGKKMIAVPEKKMKEAYGLGKDLCIFEKDVNVKTRKKDTTISAYMILPSDEIPLAYGEFEDKWGREDKYRLCYFEWKPIVQGTLFN